MAKEQEMFRTTIKTISTVLAAAAIAVPVASAGSNPRTPSVGQGFSLGVPLQYLNLNTGAPTHVSEGFALGVPLEYLDTGTPTHVSQGFSLGVPLRYLNTGAPTHVSQGFNLGVPVEYLAQPTAARGNSFDWSAAGIGAGIVAGLFLMLAGIGAMTIRSRQSQHQRPGRLSAT
jgi:hypothetical protein